MSFKIAETTPSSAVANGGTINFAYPAGTDAGSFAGSRGHVLYARGLQAKFAYNTGFTISFDTDDITVTYKGTTPIPADTVVSVQLDTLGADSGEIEVDLGPTKRTAPLTPVYINLGAPDVADPDGVCEAQSGAAGALTINGDLATGGFATFDAPRNIVVDSGGADTATLTVTGTDEYGAVLAEDITLNGTTAVAGKKAFKTVTSVVSDGTTSNGAFVGTGDVLGLPLRVSQAGLIVEELEDGAAATAGTIVAADDATAGAGTGDVRGTYDPNSAADGSAAFALLAFVPDPADRGGAQYTG